MKAGWDFDVSEYVQALGQAGVEINEVSREALGDAAQMLKGEMVRRCPSDTLRPYIQVFTPSREGDFNYVAVGYVRDLSYTPAEIAILANVIEFGSVRTAAKPHIRPAVSALKGRVNRLIAERLKAAGLVDR